jgi:hypothetical protein
MLDLVEPALARDFVFTVPEAMASLFFTEETVCGHGRYFGAGDSK